MKRMFVESPLVTRLVRDGVIAESQMRQVQQDIMTGGGRTIPGSGGLAKIRSAAPGRGKRGGMRVVFADYEDQGVTFLLAAFPKSVKEDLSAREKAKLTQLKRRLDGLMRGRNHGR